MRRLIPLFGTLAIALLFATTAKAQNGRVMGQVMDREGKPWADVTIVLKSDTGQLLTLKTDKDGKYGQIGMRGGLYTFTLTDAAHTLNFVEKHQIGSSGDTEINFDFKQLAAQQGPSEEQKKTQAESQDKFKQMQTHFNAGKAAMDDSSTLRAQLRAASPDQKSAIQDKMNADYQTAITEFEQAEQGVTAKDVKNHAIVWASLGQAYESARRFDDAANAYQKAIEIQPAPDYYAQAATALANVAAGQTDPAVTSAKLAEANADCDKAAALDPTQAAGVRCWKNVGIVLNNKGDFKDSIAPLQKATQAGPKDAQAWFLLGSAYTGSIDAKQEGDKMTYIIPPGTADAYQKCIDLDPSGPYAAQAKQNLDALAAMGGGESTAVGVRPKKKK
jgi:tetratricopeptide (TPR) repeat protein